MKFSRLLLGALFITNAHASLFNYTVYTKNGINAECSDFLGKTGSNGNVTLRDFLIQEIGSKKCPLESSGEVNLVRGSVGTEEDTRVFSCVRSQKLSTYRSGVTRNASYNLNFHQLDQQMDRISQRLSNGVAADSVILNSGDFPKMKNITLKGTISRTLIVTVRGERVKMNNLGIVLEGDIGPQNIIWHFPDATLIELSFTGMAPGREHWGIPGTFLAPKAQLMMNNALITGAVYVNEFIGHADRESCSNIVSGQVNPACLNSPELGLGCNLPPRRGGKVPKEAK